MRIQIIKIKKITKTGEHIHIVGTNSHDTLLVSGGAIYYLNLQGMTGT